MWHFCELKSALVTPKLEFFKNTYCIYTNTHTYMCMYVHMYVHTHAHHILPWDDFKKLGTDLSVEHI